MRATSGFLASLLLGSVVASCAYQPGTFSYSHSDFPGRHVTVGCLDVAIDRRPDLPNGDAVLSYEFGNRCDQPAIVDLQSVRVVGRTEAGVAVPLRAFDPHAELRPSQIDGRAVSSEAISYASTVRVAKVCVDAASITYARPAQWLCFR